MTTALHRSLAIAVEFGSEKQTRNESVAQSKQ